MCIIKLGLEPGRVDAVAATVVGRGWRGARSLCSLLCAAVNESILLTNSGALASVAEMHGGDSCRLGCSSRF